MSKGQLGCVPWLLQIPWQVARVCRHILIFHSGLPFCGEADLDFATQQWCFHSLQRMLAFIPSLHPPNTERLTYCNCFSSLKTCIWWGHICKAWTCQTARSLPAFTSSVLLLFLLISLFVVWPTALTTPQRSLFLLVKGSLLRSVQTIEGQLITLTLGSNDEPWWQDGEDYCTSRQALIVVQTLMIVWSDK